MVEHCPSCGAKTAPDANFCRECGTELGAGGPTGRRVQSGDRQQGRESGSRQRGQGPAGQGSVDGSRRGGEAPRQRAGRDGPGAGSGTDRVGNGTDRDGPTAGSGVGGEGQPGRYAGDATGESDGTSAAKVVGIVVLVLVVGIGGLVVLAAVIGAFVTGLGSETAGVAGALRPLPQLPVAA